jgi:hypothetical protein
MPTRIVRRPPSRRGNPDLTAHQAGLIARFVQLLADRAEQRLLNQAFRLRCGRTTEQVRRNCPDVDVGRQAFRLFKVPPDRCLALPVEVRAFLRWVLSRHRCQVGALSLLVGGDPADWHGYVLLDGRRTIGPPEWHRIRKLVERLEAEPGACDDFAAILVDRLNRPANRSREAVDAEVLARVMQGPVIAAAMPPRAAFPRYTRHATGAA